jgi:hypothetical protein
MIARAIDIAPQLWRPLRVQAGVTTLAGVVGAMQRKTQLPGDAGMRTYAALTIGRAAIEGGDIRSAKGYGGAVQAETHQGKMRSITRTKQP